ncbi:MAG: hypothetical protein BRC29_04595 [Nanohaloarchaea archaeon SW_7_43_1]|nr:MAG: hypothetical protein BRC29_04595 [Nanohaloarchaea archaeon SW_7_43_1]
MSFVRNWFSHVKSSLKYPKYISEGFSRGHFWFSLVFSVLMFNISLRLYGVEFSGFIQTSPIHALWGLTAILFVLIIYGLKLLLVHISVWLLGGRSISKTEYIISASTAAILPVISALLVVGIGIAQIISIFVDLSSLLGSSTGVYMSVVGAASIAPLLYTVVMETWWIRDIHNFSGRKSFAVSLIATLIVVGVTSIIVYTRVILILTVLMTIPFGGLYIP